MATHSSTLARKIPWMEEPGGLHSVGSLSQTELSQTERFHFQFSLSCTGEGNGNPLQCSCLENPRDRGAWGAAVYGVAQSRTRLKWLSSSSSLKTNTSLGCHPKRGFIICWFIALYERTYYLLFSKYSWLILGKYITFTPLPHRGKTSIFSFYVQCVMMSSSNRCLKNAHKLWKLNICI